MLAVLCLLVYKFEEKNLVYLKDTPQKFQIDTLYTPFGTLVQKKIANLKKKIGTPLGKGAKKSKKN